MSLVVVFAGAALATILSSLSVIFSDHGSLSQALAVLALVAAWLSVLLYKVPTSYESLFLYSALLGPTLAAMLGEAATASMAGAVAAGAIVALARPGNPVVFLLGLETSIVASYAAIALGSREEARDAALEFFVASSVATVLIAIGLFGYGNEYSYAIIVMGSLLELAVAPLHLWGVDVVEKASLPGILAAFTAPKIPVLYLLLAFSAKGYRTVYATVYSIALLSALWSSMVGASSAKRPRSVLAYGSIAHLSIPLFLLPGASLSHSILAYYVACYVLGEAGFIALAYSWETNVDTKPALDKGIGVFVAALLLGLAGLPPAASFLAKVLVVLASAASTARFLAALASLLVSTPLITYFYYEALRTLYTGQEISKQSLFVLIFASAMLIALFPFAPMR